MVKMFYGGMLETRKEFGLTFKEKHRTYSTRRKNGIQDDGCEWDVERRKGYNG